MPNFTVHGIGNRGGHYAHIRADLIKEVTGKWPALRSDVVVGNARDEVTTPNAEDAPYVEIRSTNSPGTPTLQELAEAIKPVCVHYGLDIELVKLDGFVAKDSMPRET